VGPRAGLDEIEKGKCLPYRDSNSDPSVIQPVASCYTDCAIPALSLQAVQNKVDECKQNLMNCLDGIVDERILIYYGVEDDIKEDLGKDGTNM
jgi:hypothetical protein